MLEWFGRLHFRLQKTVTLLFGLVAVVFGFFNLVPAWSSDDPEMPVNMHWFWRAMAMILIGMVFLSMYAWISERRKKTHPDEYKDDGYPPIA